MAPLGEINLNRVSAKSNLKKKCLLGLNESSLVNIVLNVSNERLLLVKGTVLIFIGYLNKANVVHSFV